MEWMMRIGRSEGFETLCILMTRRPWVRPSTALHQASLSLEWARLCPLEWVGIGRGSMCGFVFGNKDKSEPGAEAQTQSSPASGF